MRRHERPGPALGTLVLLAAVAAVGVAACGGSSSHILSTVGNSIGSEGQPAPVEAPSAPPQAPAGSGSQQGGGTGDQLSAPRDGLKIVYTGSLLLVVDDLPAALEKARAAVLATGGYIGASEESNAGEDPVATISYRIPATGWDGAIADLRGLATKVVAEQTQATEVGGQIVDLEARIRNLRASEASLQEIAKGAGRISDLLEVEGQLTQVRGQIEQLDGERAQLEDQVAYGTLVTTFGLQTVAVEAQAQGWDPREDVDGAFATMIGVGQTVVSGLIWFTIVWLPILAVVVAIALVVRWAVRRFGAWIKRGGGPLTGWGEGPGGR